MSLFKKPLFWIATSALAVAGYFLTTPPASTGPTIKAAASHKKAKNSKFDFTKADFDASFQTVQVSVHDAFKPLVARGSGKESDVENQIPELYAGGEKGWVYTGNAEVSGVKNALLENRSSNEGVFVKLGETWKGSKVISISGDSIVLSNGDNQHTFRLVNEESKSANLTANVRPMAVDVPQTMRGNIPQLPGVRGATGDVQAFPDTNADSANSNVMTVPGGDQ